MTPAQAAAVVTAQRGTARGALLGIGSRAVEQMCQGLIAPSDARWLAGARALTRAPLHIVAQAVTPRSELDVDDVARIRLYARRGEAAASQDARADLFGALLGTCVHCHAVLRHR